MRIRTFNQYFLSTLFFLFAFNFAAIASAQTINSLEAKLDFIKIGNQQIPQKDWDGLKIHEGESLTFGFSSSVINKDQVYFRIFFDGEILQMKMKENEYTFENPKLGIHILRIIPTDAVGNIGKALVFSFSVLEKEKAIKKAEQSTDFRINPIIIYAVAIFILLQMVLIIFLLIKRKANESSAKEKNDALQELSELRQSYRRIIDELKNQKEENDYLKKQKKELDLTIEQLEQSNVNLLKQKEKLNESKRKLELLHSQKEELFAIAVHDIKNPAAAIQGYIQLLNSYELNSNEQHEIMMSLASSSENIVKLSQNMCEIIAKAMPEPKLGLTKTSLINIVNDVCNQNMAYAKTKKVKLLNKGSRDIPDLVIDPEKIQEAIDNYVNNAIKYAPPETTIEIRTYIKQSDNKKVIVEVNDNGVGLSEKDLENCFQKGAILSSVPTGLEQSSGLGLWIVKKIVEEHKGKVFVDSKLGAGSTFGFELPME
jgi:signal transduction histidine kinase